LGEPSWSIRSLLSGEATSTAASTVVVDDNLIKRVAKMAKISIADHEVPSVCWSESGHHITQAMTIELIDIESLVVLNQVRADFARILHALQTVQSVNTDAIEPLVSVIDAPARSRPDIPIVRSDEIAFALGMCDSSAATMLILHVTGDTDATTLLDCSNKQLE
jgi:Asp-tRNA(Asn)/Glu-tRNA(Gln) amidotransferase C subunit